jgi:type II secretory pathway component PulC
MLKTLSLNCQKVKNNNKTIIKKHKIDFLTKLLESINNLRLIHKEYHKTKTFELEEQEVLKEYHKTRKSLVLKGIKLSILNKNEL